MAKAKVNPVIGRPTEWTKQIETEVCDLIRETACSFYTAGLSLGIEWRNLYRWEEWGREGREPYASFCQNVMRARAEAEIAFVRQIVAGVASGANVQPLQWLLDRRYPVDYGTRIKLEQQLSSLSDDEIQAEREALRSRALDSPRSGE